MEWTVSGEGSDRAPAIRDYDSGSQQFQTVRLMGYFPRNEERACFYVLWGHQLNAQTLVNPIILSIHLN